MVSARLGKSHRNVVDSIMVTTDDDMSVLYGIIKTAGLARVRVESVAPNDGVIWQ